MRRGSRGPDYLREELHERLASGPVRFTLEAQIAAPGDDPDDPSREWPGDRERVTVGTLELDAIAPDPEADGGIFVFDPTRVTDGIELSDDPVLLFRAKCLLGVGRAPLALSRGRGRRARVS